MTTSSTNHYQSYVDKTIQLAETIVIKSDDVANAINAHVQTYHSDVDFQNPYSWKYYMNIAGEMHSSQVPMEVVSLDTLQKIAFTKENLVRHRATAKGYVYGSRYYRELVGRFPDQWQLIFGIVYPVDKKTAIEAQDGQILRILPGMVEENEYSFLNNLQTWVYGHKLRWVNREYGLTENLYATSALGIMHAMLFPAVMMQRKAACLTNEAHSYHVRMYLLSHGLKDEDIDHLTLKQSLWLYRNIKYIRKHAGSSDTFNMLIEHILSERLIPLADYTMRHDLSGMPDNFYPDLTFRRKPLNLGYSVNSLDNIGLNQLLRKEDPLARANPKAREDTEIAITAQMRNSQSNVLMTKALESTMVDYTDSEFYSLADILLNEWLYLSVNDMYVTAIQVLQPAQGTRIPMKAKDAFAVMWWCYTQAMGVELINVPTLAAIRVQRLVPPTVEEMLSVVDKKLVSRELAQYSHDLNPVFTQIISIEEFHDVCHEIFIAANMQRNLYALQEHMDARGYVQAMNNRIYTDAVCPLSLTGETYKQLFRRLNMSLDDLDRSNYESMWKEIVADATGASLTTTKSVKDMQAAMLRIMKQLSSYSVQYMAVINEGKLISTDMPGVRVGDDAMSTYGTIELPDLVIGVVEVRQEIGHTRDYDINGCRLHGSIYAQMQNTIYLELPHLLHLEESGMINEHLMDAAPIQIQFTGPIPTNTEGTFPMPGIEGFLAMSPEQRKKLADAWNEAN